MKNVLFHANEGIYDCYLFPSAMWRDKLTKLRKSVHEA